MESTHHPAPGPVSDFKEYDMDIPYIRTLPESQHWNWSGGNFIQRDLALLQSGRYTLLDLFRRGKVGPAWYDKLHDAAEVRLPASRRLEDDCTQRIMKLERQHDGEYSATSRSTIARELSECHEELAKLIRNRLDNEQPFVYSTGHEGFYKAYSFPDADELPAGQSEHERVHHRVHSLPDVDETPLLSRQYQRRQFTAHSLPDTDFHQPHRQGTLKPSTAPATRVYGAGNIPLAHPVEYSRTQPSLDDFERAADENYTTSYLSVMALCRDFGLMRSTARLYKRTFEEMLAAIKEREQHGEMKYARLREMIEHSGR